MADNLTEPMPQIKDLSASQLAYHASQALTLRGRAELCARLTYHALVLNPNEPKGLTVLVSYFDQDKFENFSAVVLEYACSSECSISAEDKAEFEELRFQVKWFWGFSHRLDGQKFLRFADFANRSDFVVEEERYQEWLVRPLVKTAGSLTKAMRAAHTLLGCSGELLSHKQLGRKALFEEVYFPERFNRSPEYKEWLNSTTADLPTLEIEWAKLRT